MASGVKAIFTTDSLKSIEILRRAAGGHGFSMYSGLPALLSELGPTPTFEGTYSLDYRLKFSIIFADGQISPEMCPEFAERKNSSRNLHLLIVN